METLKRKDEKEKEEERKGKTTMKEIGVKKAYLSGRGPRNFFGAINRHSSRKSKFVNKLQ